MKKICKTCRHAYQRGALDIARTGDADKPLTCWIQHKKRVKAHQKCAEWEGHIEPKRD